MATSLTGRTALVTGASSGVGFAVSQALAANGVNLRLVGRRFEVLESIAEPIRQRGLKVTSHPADFNSTEELDRFCGEVRQSPLTIDILVHCAGQISQSPVENESAGAFDAQYFCNLRAPYVLSQAFLPSLKELRGDIVFINSTAALGPAAGAAAYAATKGGLKSFADALRAEVNVHGIRVLSVFLGRTATPMQEKIFQREGRSYRGDLLLQPADVAETVVNILRLPRTAEVTEMTIRPAIKSY